MGDKYVKDPAFVFMSFTVFDNFGTAAYGVESGSCCTHHVSSEVLVVQRMVITDSKGLLACEIQLYAA